jgi:hypothetical protein
MIWCYVCVFFADSEWSTQALACPGRVHFVFVSHCNAPSDWQAEGVVFSIFETRMKGTITRLVYCEDARYEYPPVWNPCYNIHIVPNKTVRIKYNNMVDTSAYVGPGGGSQFEGTSLLQNSYNFWVCLWLPKVKEWDFVYVKPWILSFIGVCIVYLFQKFTLILCTRNCMII